MADAIQAPQEASAETQEILKELEAEGRGEVPGPAESKEEKPEEVKPEEPKPEKVEEPKEEPKPKTERQTQYVPVGKHNEERHKRQEAEAAAKQAKEEADVLRAQIASLSSKPSESELDDVKTVAKKIAEKHGLDESFVNDFAESIVDVASKRSSLPKDIEGKLAALEQARKEAETAKLLLIQDKAFEDEFSSVIQDFPELADRKSDLKQLAFAEGNENSPLRRLALEYRYDNGLDKSGRKTAESPHGGKKDKTEDLVDFAEMTDEQLESLDGERLDQYFEWRAKHK